nr:MAG TPA: hypothetical protein [Caudoviricetes sp.]DAX71271.1 MAG TPA: hypothetical protein [Bacteriophage sp.]
MGVDARTHGYRVASISKYSRVRGVGYSIT